MNKSKQIIKLIKTTMNNSNIQAEANEFEHKEFLSGIGAQQKWFDRAICDRAICDDGDDKFFVVYQQPIGDDKFTNTYSSFININSFLNHYKIQDEEDKRYYELIKNECVEYYDIDGKWTDGWESIEDLLCEFTRLRSDFAIDNQMNDTNILFQDLIVTEACNKIKMSLHIIIRRDRFFNSCKDQKVWATCFNKWIIENTQSKIRLDLSVYNSNSLMRLVGSHKGNDPTRKFKPYGVAKRIKDMRLFYCSYVEDLSCLSVEIKHDVEAEGEGDVEGEGKIQTENQDPPKPGELLSLITLIKDHITNKLHSLCDT